MKIAYQRGKNDYLVVEDSVEQIGPQTMGRILDSGDGKLYPELPVQSILARGYWDEFTGSQSILEPLLDEAEEVEAPETDPEPDTISDEYVVE